MFHSRYYYEKFGIRSDWYWFFILSNRSDWYKSIDYLYTNISLTYLYMMDYVLLLHNKIILRFFRIYRNAISLNTIKSQVDIIRFLSQFNWFIYFFSLLPSPPPPTFSPLSRNYYYYTFKYSSNLIRNLKI